MRSFLAESMVRALGVVENEGAKHYAEVVCGVDSDPLLADADTRSVVVNRFVEGAPDFNSFDNLDFQPRTGNLYVIEDHPNGDVFACLPDGKDRDIKLYLARLKLKMAQR